MRVCRQYDVVTYTVIDVGRRRQLRRRQRNIQTMQRRMAGTTLGLQSLLL